MTYILGISCFFHDSSATLIKNGQIINAVQEERFSRIKHDANFPKNSIKFILKENKIKLSEIEFITFQDKPLLKFNRLLKTYISNAPFGYKSFKTSFPTWLTQKIFQKKFIYKNLLKIDKDFDINKILFSEHHMAHAASAFYPSPFNEAIIINIDGVGEWATTTIAIGKGNKIEVKNEIHFPHSVGLLYSAFTYYVGFKVNSGEYKLMGLAPYGEPKYSDIILTELIDLKDDGSFRLNLNYFDFETGTKMINEKFCKLFNKKIRDSNIEDLEQFHMDIAASIQFVIEKIILKISRYAKKQYDINNLCLSGGVALNCVANSKILNDKKFKKIWIQPASGDAGGSLGSALLYWYNELNNERSIDPNDSMKGSFLGPAFDDDQIKRSLDRIEAKYVKLSDKELLNEVSDKLIDGKIVGWFQGKMEFGPRALGSRSIIADPRVKDMQKKLNLKIKFRESFRPFAPAILLEYLEEWFDINCESPYMLMVSEIKKNKKINENKNNSNYFGIEKLNQVRSIVPSITHIDYSSRIQTVTKKYNKRFYELISIFYNKTGCPILINTSFNIRGEPIVMNTENAFRCFMGTDMDYLAIGNFLLFKGNQDKNLLKDYRSSFDLD